MGKLRALFQRKNLLLIVPSLVSLILVIAGIYGIQLDEQVLTNQIIVGVGIIGTVIGIFKNPDKKDKERK